ncbi:hypothetical protein M405DRAFT_867399 [Rhizopogon salebrosus TDB-379]|nr:hypothetical protein M405DRAFT_867399 [Rhizopogon salebrosus TDB-379]
MTTNAQTEAARNRVAMCTLVRQSAISFSITPKTSVNGGYSGNAQRTSTKLHGSAIKGLVQNAIHVKRMRSVFRSTAHDTRIAQMEAELKAEVEVIADVNTAKQREAMIKQKEREIQEAKVRAQKNAGTSKDSGGNSSQPTSSSPQQPPDPSSTPSQPPGS